MQKKIQKHQIVMIGGGNAYDNDAQSLDFLIKYQKDPLEYHPSWKKWLSDGLSDHFDTIRIDMPNTMNAKYDEWKVWFEKHFKHINGTHHHLTHRTTLERLEEKKHDEIHANNTKLILIGHSLGGIFLMKYLSESGFPRSIDAIHLVAPVLDNEGLDGETVGTFAFAQGGLPHLHKSIPHIHLWASTDDDVVPYDHSIRYHIAMLGSVLHTLHDRGHFSGQAHFVELFEEILKMAK